METGVEEVLVDIQKRKAKRSKKAIEDLQISGGSFNLFTLRGFHGFKIIIITMVSPPHASL